MRRIRDRQGGMLHGELRREHFTRLWGVKWRVMTHLRLPECPYCGALVADREAQDKHMAGPCWQWETLKDIITWWETVQADQERRGSAMGPWTAVVEEGAAGELPDA